MKKILFAAILPALILAGCSSDNSGSKHPDGRGSIRVVLQGDANPTGRIIGPSTPNPAVEDLVSNFTVYVFNYVTGDMERTQTFTEVTGTNYTAQISDLSTGTEKRVVVLVNVPTDMDLSGITSYGALRQNNLTLDSQYAADIEQRGLFMSGESAQPVVLQPSDQNTVPVTVRRRVSKVVLRSLQVTPAAEAAIGEFALTGVSIQKARLTGTPIGPILAYGDASTANYAGGTASPAGATEQFTVTRTYLLDALAVSPVPEATEIIATTADQRYFYVLPNNNANDIPTMMAIQGTYGLTPAPAYYPFVINGTANGTGGSSTTGTFIDSNTIYNLDITLSQIQLPSDDPNVVPTDVVMTVVITVANWEGPINQVVEW